MQQKILVVDDDSYFNKMISAFLKKNGFSVNSVFTSKSAMECIASDSPDLVLTDFKLPDLNGLELMELIKAKIPDQTMILVTNYSNIRTAVQSIKLGAFEFITKPVNPDELLLTINAALEQKQIKKDITISQEMATSDKNIRKKYIMGKAEPSIKLWEHIQLVAPTKMSVMIFGESGTGKEYAARMIHEYSKRKQDIFVAVDCGALSKELAASELFGHMKGAFTGALKDKKGLFELAHGGTIFLDEVGNLPYDVQVQLLRSLQEFKIRRVGNETDISIDVRIISATNKQMTSAIEEHHFRLDLYHRLNEFELTLSPLRNRIEDMDVYTNFFLAQANIDLEKNVKGFTDEVIHAFNSYIWPGNLRELRNIVRRSVLMSQDNWVRLSQIPEALVKGQKVEDNTACSVRNFKTKLEMPESTDLKQLQEQNEKETIERVLLKTKYNKSKAAAILNIDRTTLYHKIAKYKIEV